MSPHAMRADHPAHELRQELETYVIQKEHSSRKFITKTSIEKCWPDDLQQLRRKLGLQWEDTTLLSILAKECRVIACILAWIKYERFDRTLHAICCSVRTSRLGQGSAILEDSQLTIDQDQCIEIFDFQAGQLFYSTQFIFCPILISSAEEGIHEVADESRWPYKASPVEIGLGAYGRVYKVAIVKGQLQATKDSSNDEDTLVAFKRVSKPTAWRREVKTLDFLRGSLSGHKRLLLHIAAFIQGADFLIFLPYTPYGDLESFLREGTLQDDNSEDVVIYDFAEEFHSFDQLDLAREFAAIIDATAYLHERVSSFGGLPVYCAHVDLRTKNILVFPGGDKSPAGVWHISDFGISSIKLEGGQALPEPVWSKYPSMGDIVGGRWSHSGEQTTYVKLVGPHVAPEMSLHGIFVPKRSDMWSLGCIFAEILVFGLGTKQKGNRKRKLTDFRKERCSWRRSWGESDRDDYFFNRSIEQSPDSNDFEVTVSRRPKVDEWLTHLYDQGGELYRSLISTVNEMLHPDPRKRCDAKFASDSVLTACKTASIKSHQIHDAHAYGPRELSVDSWTFLATQEVAKDDPSGGLSFVRHLETRGPSEAFLKGSNRLSSNWSNEDESKGPLWPSISNTNSFKTYQSLITAPKELSRMTWPPSESLDSKTVVHSVASPCGTLVCLCQKQENSGSRNIFGHRRSLRKEEYELWFCTKAEHEVDRNEPSAHSLPQNVKWNELRVIGKHVIVTGQSFGSSNEDRTYLYDFFAGVEVEMPTDRAVSKMHKFTSSGGELLAAYDDKGFTLWHSSQIVFQHSLVPKLGRSGQIAFSGNGAFLFTWSIYEHSVAWIWSIEPSGPPQIQASYIVPTLNRRGNSRPLLIPCGNLPACIMRTRHGTWYTASAEIGNSLQEHLTAVEQTNLGTNLPQSAALCKADERHLFYLCGKGVLRMCDLAWDNINSMRLVNRREVLAESTVKNADNLTLYEKAGGTYVFIISNREGETESIEVELQVSDTLL